MRSPFNGPRPRPTIDPADGPLDGYDHVMVEPPAPLRPDDVGRPCPGQRVVAACDLPTETHARKLVKSGTEGEILRTPAYFTNAYSIKFSVHGTGITLHRINRHEFRIVGEAPTVATPTYPASARYPQPLRVRTPGQLDDVQRDRAGEGGSD